jgi:AsmA protein
MIKKVAAAGLLVVVALVVGVLFWGKSILTSDRVRAALAEQVGKAIGQPVSVGSIDATIMPRVTVTLGDVTIGEKKQIAVGSLHVGTDFHALLSRRIERASVRLAGARVELPLPTFTIAASPEPAEATKPPVELVSIDEIVLSDVQVVSGGRTVRGDIEIVPEGKGLRIRKAIFGAGETSIDISGQIADLTGPVGDLTVKAGALDLDQLLAFANDFSAGASTGAETAAASPKAEAAPSSPAAPAGVPAAGVPAGMRMTLALDAERATLGGLTLSKISGKAAVNEAGLTLDPVSFGIFGGQYQGSLALTPVKDVLHFRGASTLSNIDVAAATAFGGSPNVVSGRLSGRVEFAGRGADPSSVVSTTTAKARVDVVNGVVKNLGLLQAAVLATSMRAEGIGQAASLAKSGSRDEPFSKVGATIVLANGAMSTNDLQFESRDVLLSAEGVVQLAASTVNLKGRVQLSDALSQQANAELVRYTQDKGRVTLPATVSGSLQAPRVGIDAGDMAKRALRNAANEQKERAKAEATKAVSKKLSGLFGR